MFAPISLSSAELCCLLSRGLPFCISAQTVAICPIWAVMNERLQRTFLSCCIRLLVSCKVCSLLELSDTPVSNELTFVPNWKQVARMSSTASTGSNFTRVSAPYCASATHQLQSQASRWSALPHCKLCVVFITSNFRADARRPATSLGGACTNAETVTRLVSPKYAASCCKLCKAELESTWVESIGN